MEDTAVTAEEEEENEHSADPQEVQFFSELVRRCLAESGSRHGGVRDLERN